MNINDIIEFLNANENKTIKTVRADLTEMLEQLTIVNRPLGRTFLVGSDNKVFAIFCWYHKQWELLSEVEYGQKVSSSTGYNTMCKIGVREWTKEQKLLKLLPGECLELVETGKLKFEQVPDYRKKRTLEIKQINKDTMPKGYANQEDIPQK